MQYATQQDMIDSFGEEELIRLTDTNDAPGVIDDAAVSRALDRVSADIDAYVAQRYPQPFEVIPRLLVGIACDMARYRLCGIGGRLMSDEVRDRHKDAVAMLKLIAAGDVKFGVDVQDNPIEPLPGVQTTQVMSSSVLAEGLRDYPQ